VDISCDGEVEKRKLMAEELGRLSAWMPKLKRKCGRVHLSIV